MKPQFSFHSKLAAMDVGDVIYVPDHRGIGKTPTKMERAVQTAMVKAKKVEGRRFATARAHAVTAKEMKLEILLRVERTE